MSARTIWTARSTRNFLARPGVADRVAEALIGHQHDCAARWAAENVLEMARLSERVFVSRWAAGDFDA
jgi:hypothetical protein